jgi:hypothetical protein
MPAAFEIKHIAPANLTAPEKLRYEYMLYRLSKILCITPLQAEELSEKDFWLIAAFENLEGLKREHLNELRIMS